VLRSGGIVVACGALAVALAAASTRWLNDPVEVVGRPLVDGFSEKAESTAWAIFLTATAVVSSVAVRRLWPIGVEALLPLLVPVPFVLAFWRGSWMGMILYLTAVIASFGAGGRVSFIFGFLVWAITFPWLAWQEPVVVAVLLSPLSAAAGVVHAFRSRFPFVNVAKAVLVLTATAFTTTTLETATATGIGAAAWFLGMRSGGRGFRFRHGSWLAASAVAVAPLLWLDLCLPYGDAGPAVLLLAGAGLAAMAADIRRPTIAWGNVHPHSAGVAAATILTAFAWGRPWCAAILTPAFAAAWFARPGWRNAWLIAALLPMAFLSAGPAPRPFDPFHDAQVLSAVGEMSRGRTLYADVFPLRGYEFFLAWIGNRFLPASLSAYAWTTQVLQFLPLGGAALLAFSWTRSLSWSLATALAVAIPFVQDGRVGWHFWFAAAGLAMLRSRGVTAIFGVLLAGMVAAAWGYDLLIPFAAASVLGTAVASRSLASTAAVGAMVMLPWTFALIAWQGVESATTYWTLLIEYSRYYPAAYGLPLRWDDAHRWPMILAPLVVGGSWAGGVGAAWNRMTPARQGTAVFLVVQFALAAQRGLGRSDIPHLISLIPLVIVWSMLGLWSLMAAARIPPRTRRAAGLIAGLMAFGLSPHGRVAPSEWLEVFGRVRRDPPIVLPRDPLLGNRLKPGDTIWDVRNADSYLAYDGTNPTRHALAYCIPSPKEQRTALEALKRRPPRLIFWQHPSKSDLSAPDIANPLRYYRIAPWVYQRYRPLPSSNRLVLEPAPHDWQGMDDVERRFGGPLPLGWLAERWGAERAPTLAPLKRQTVALDGSKAMIVPRHWNYLFVEADAEGPTTVRLDFQRHDGTWDDVSNVEWRMTGDGRRRYLIPVGCSPGWTWRKAIGGLRVVATEGALRVHSAELWQVEE